MQYFSWPNLEEDYCTHQQYCNTWQDNADHSSIILSV